MEMKRIGVFVGVLLVGFLMLSLVAGAGYNVVVPSVDPPADPVSPGGGGGGGGAVVNVTNVTSNETVLGDVVAGEEEESLVDSIGDSIAEVVEEAKKSWVWLVGVIVLLAAVVGAVVYFKKRR